MEMRLCGLFVCGKKLGAPLKAEAEFDAPISGPKAAGGMHDNHPPTTVSGIIVREV